MSGRSLVRPSRGFAYLWVLLAIAFMGIGITLVSEVYSTSLQRQREQELLFIGHQFRDALARYQMVKGSGGQTEYPPNLEDLLRDGRSPALLRHLRKIYTDPMTGEAEWGVVRVAGRIVGIYSLSEKPPIKREGFELADANFRGAKHYKDWVFTYPYDLLLKADGAAGVSKVKGLPDGMVKEDKPVPPASIETRRDDGKSHEIL